MNGIMLIAMNVARLCRPHPLLLLPSVVVRCLSQAVSVRACILSQLIDPISTTQMKTIMTKITTKRDTIKTCLLVRVHEIETMSCNNGEIVRTQMGFNTGNRANGEIFMILDFLRGGIRHSINNQIGNGSVRMFSTFTYQATNIIGPVNVTKKCIRLAIRITSVL